MSRFSVVLVVGLAACKGPIKLPELEAALPKVRFQNMNVDDVTWEGATTRFTFQVDNPHPIGLDLAAVNWDLDLAGSDFLDGNKDTEVQIAAQGQSDVRFPVSLKWSDVLAVVNGAQGQDTIPFALAGDLKLDTPLGPLTVPFQHAGDLPVLHAPKVRLTGLRVDKLDLLKQTASLALDMTVETEQSAPLDFRAFNYGIELAGAKVVSGNAQIGAVAGSREVSLPIDLQLLNLGAAVVQAVTKKERLLVGLDADATLGTPLGELPLKFTESTTLQLR